MGATILKIVKLVTNEYKNTLRLLFQGTKSCIYIHIHDNFLNNNKIYTNYLCDNLVYS